MPKLFQPFLLLLATATDRELARQMQFLTMENQLLRSRLPKRIRVTPAPSVGASSATANRSARPSGT